MPDADGLRGAADRTVEAGGQGWPWAFTRCWLLAHCFDQHGRDPRDLDAALAAFATLPDGVPGRSRLAAVLVNLHIRVGGLRTPETIDPVARLAAIADLDPTPFPQWPADRSVVRAGWLAISLMYGRTGVTHAAALAEIEQLAVVVGDRDPHARMIELARVSAEHHRSRETDDQVAMSNLGPSLAAAFGEIDPGSAGAVRARMAVLMQELMSILTRGDADAARRHVDELAKLRIELPPDDRFGQDVDVAVSTFQSMMSMVPGGDTAPLGPTTQATFDGLDAMRAAAAAPGLSPTERAIRLHSLGGIELGIGEDRIGDAVAHLREAVELAPPEDARRVEYATTFGTALIARYEMRRGRRDLHEAITVLERARELAGGPQHRSWTILGMSLGHALRLAGRRPHGDQVGLAGLRGHAWTVLLQSSVDAAVSAARHAGSEAVDVARWFLADGDAAGAAAALEAGRGLVLRSAAQFGDVDSRLRTRGADDLARRWRAVVGSGAPEAAPAGLRRDVLTQLSTPVDGSAGREGALEAPEPAEVRAALASLDLDALVYLVPGEDGAGAAVIAPVADQPYWLPLPRLALNRETDLANWLAQDTAAGLRDVGSEGPVLTSSSDWEKDLARVCRWAWDAVLGPLLRVLRTPPGRPPRLAFMPMGPLARVPWHAAHDGARYAVQQATITYTVSGRTLCDTAWTPGLPFEGGLVIGDPTGDLRSARAEALAVRDVCYPGARYVGRGADGQPAVDGPGDRDDVLRWLADGRGTVLHAACHGRVTGGADGAYLHLACGTRLTAGELVRAVAGRRGLALAVLAACSSGVPSTQYDEAFSLGSAFLGAGARSVVSAAWPVPDDATSVLMFLFHHFLRTCGPLDALCAAQRWMLEPPYRFPDAMPQPLRQLVRASDPADVSAWAGFSHAGR